MANTTAVADRLEAKAVSRRATGPTVYDLIERQKPAIARALPQTGLTADRLARIVATQIRTNPNLASCDADSLLGALMLTAQLGLEPGPLGHAYFVPFKNRVTFIIGYKGLINVAYRGGIVISAHAVYSNDQFKFDYGTDKVEHTYYLESDRGNLVAVWAKAVLSNGMTKIKVMSKKEVDAHRKRSNSGDSGPWHTDYEAMAVKTCIRVLCSQLPMSTEAQRAIAADETAVVFNGDEGIIQATDAPAVIDVTEQCEVEVER